MTAKSEFKKWFSACRACVRDQRNAGADGVFFADYHGVRFSSGTLSTGLERADLYKNHNVKRYDNAMFWDAANIIMRKRTDRAARLNSGCSLVPGPASSLGRKWLRATVTEMRQNRLHTYN